MPMNVPISATGTTRRGNQRGAEVLQEQQHHQEHQHDRLDQRLDHLVDRDLDEARAVVRDRPLHARREARGELVHRARAPRRRRPAHWRRAAAGSPNAGRAAGRRARVECRSPAGAELDARHVAERAPVGAVGVGAQDDVAELLGRRSSGLRRSRCAVNPWPGAAAAAPIEPAANLHVLRADRGQRHPSVDEVRSPAACPGRARSASRTRSRTDCALPRPRMREIGSRTCDAT